MVQLHINTSYQTTTWMSPYEAVDNKKTYFLAHFGVPYEHWNQIDTKQYLSDHQNEINENTISEEYESSVQRTRSSDNEFSSSPLSSHLRQIFTTMRYLNRYHTVLLSLKTLITSILYIFLHAWYQISQLTALFR